MNPRDLKRKPGKNGNYQRNLQNLADYDHFAVIELQEFKKNFLRKKQDFQPPDIPLTPNDNKKELRMLKIMGVTQSRSGFFNHSDEKGEGTLSKEEKKLQSTDSKKDCHPTRASSAGTSDVINTKKYDLASPRNTNGIALFDPKVPSTESEEKILEKKIKHLFADIEKQLLATIGDFALYPSGNTWTKYRIQPFNDKDGYKEIPIVHFKKDQKYHLDTQEGKNNMGKVIDLVDQYNECVQKFNQKLKPKAYCHP